MKKLCFVSVLAAFMLFFFLGCSAGHLQKDISDKIIRIHVRANSDSAEDQQLKLQVRDAILYELGGMLLCCENKQQAEKAIIENLPGLEESANKLTLKKGYTAAVSLQKEFFPKRKYEDFSLPAGEYEALCVNIGDADGENWWCIAYPTFCLSAASDKESVFTREELKLIENGGAEIRFKILDIIAAIKKQFR